MQTAALNRLSCHRLDSFWQTTVSQCSEPCHWLCALLLAWHAAARRLYDRFNFTLTRALHSLPVVNDVIVLPHKRTHTHGRPLLFYSPLATTFRCLHFSRCPKNNTRHVVHRIEYTHICRCINTGRPHA